MSKPNQTRFVRVERPFYSEPGVVAEVGAVLELPYQLGSEIIACGRGSAHGGPAAPAPKARAKSDKADG